MGRAVVFVLAVGVGMAAGCADEGVADSSDTAGTESRSPAPEADSATAGDTGSTSGEDARAGRDTGESPPETGGGIEDTGSTRDTGTGDPSGGDTGATTDTGSGSGGDGSPDVYRFIVMGDTGEGDDKQVKVARAAQDRCDRAGGCHGFLMLGDNIYDTGPDSAQDKQFTTKIDKPYRRLKYGAPPAQGQPDNRKRLPIYVSLGNHDLGGAGLESQLTQHYLDYAKKHSWFVYPEEYWEKKVGNVHLMSIHTNPLAYKGTKTEPQGKMVENALASTSADWTIVFGHHPYRSNGSHGNAGSYEGVPGDLTPFGGDYREWVNTYVCDKVDFLLTAHDHNRQWINRMPELTGETFGGGDDDKCETHLAVSGAGAKTRDMEDNDNDLAFGKPTLGFLFMEFHDRKVDVEYVDDAGKTEWSKTITK